MKHAFLMYLFKSHSGRNTQSHYVVHFRLNLELISNLMVTGLLNRENQHSTDYSLVIKDDIDFNTTKHAGGRYQFATIRLIRDIMDYQYVRESKDYASDGSLYFDFCFDIPEAILDTFCTKAEYASVRTVLLDHCAIEQQGLRALHELLLQGRALLT